MATPLNLSRFQPFGRLRLRLVPKMSSFAIPKVMLLFRKCPDGMRPPMPKYFDESAFVGAVGDELAVPVVITGSTRSMKPCRKNTNALPGVAESACSG